MFDFLEDFLSGVERLDEFDSDSDSDDVFDEDDVPELDDESSELEFSLDDSSLELLDELLVDCLRFRFFLEAIFFCLDCSSEDVTSSLSFFEGFFLAIFFFEAVF